MLLSACLFLFVQVAPVDVLSVDGAAPPLHRQLVSSADVDWLLPLLGRPHILAATSSGFGPTTIPTSAGPEGDLPQDVVFTADGSQYLIAHRDSRNVLAFDAATRVFVREIPVSGSPLGIDVSPDGVWAATVNGFEGTVSLIDLASGLEVAVVDAGSVPSSLDFTPDSSKVVVGNFGSSSLSVIDLASATELFEIPLNGFASVFTFAPESAAVTFRGTTVLCVDSNTAVVPQFFDDQVAFCDLTTGLVNAVATAADPRGVSFAPAVGRLAVAHTGAARTVSLFDTVTQSVVGTFATTQNLNGPIALRSDGTSVALAVLNAAFVLDLVTGVAGPNLNTATIDEMIPTADGLFALGVGFRGALIDFANQSLSAQLNNQVSMSFGAVSPVNPIAVMTGATFAEDVVVVNTAGGAGAGLIEVLSSGVAPEGDVPRRIAVSADGTRAVVTNVLSDNASVLDLATGALLGVVETGDRPSGVAITPDGSKAVVANLDSTFATVIDMATLVPTNVPISRRGAEVEISPNGQYAYINVVANGDGVWRIDLTTNSVAGGKLLTGNMGGVPGAFGPTSGLTLSPDGTRLLVCASFDNVITIVDAVNWSVLGNVPVADFPVRAVFVGAGPRFLVTCTGNDELVSLDLTATSAVETGRITLGFRPLDLVVDATGSRAFGLDIFNNELEVIDLNPLAMFATVALPAGPLDLAYDATSDTVEVQCGDYVTSVGGAVGFLVEESGRWMRFDAQSLGLLGETSLGLTCAEVDGSGGRLAGCAIRRDQVVAGPRAAALEADTIELSVSAGGTLSLALHAGALNANLVYFIVGSANGTSPGFNFGGALIPLVFDFYTLATINQANTGSYVNTFGTLDATGHANASLVLPAGSPASLVGASVDHAFVVFTSTFPSIGFVSNPVSLTLVD